MTQVYAIECLARGSPMMLQDLAAEMCLDKSTMSRVVDALETAGIVRRVRHPADGRALQLTLTAAGLRSYARIESDLVSEARRVLGGFSPAVQETFPDFIDQFADAAQERPVLRNNPPARRQQRRR